MQDVRITLAHDVHVSYMDTTIGPFKDVSAGPKSPDLEIMWAPAIATSLTSGGKPGDNGVTLVRLHYVGVDQNSLATPGCYCSAS